MSTAAMAEQAAIDGGVPATAKDKWSNEAVTEHHGNPVKLELDFARAEAHRRATATVKRTRRRCCRPRGRKATHSGSPVESSFNGWSAGCARSKRSYDRLCRGWERMTATAQLNGAAVAATGKTEEQNGEKPRR